MRAHATMRRVLNEAEDVVTRSRMLGPYVEIALGGGDVAAARGAAEELSRIAAVWSTPFLSALSSHATGSVLLAEGDARAALAAFRRAWAGWGELNAPYDAARSHVLIGLACRALGDEDSAQMELDAARSVFLQLDSRPRPRRGTVSDHGAPGRRRLDRPRGAGAEAGRDWDDQSGHRVRARDQREDGGHPREQHLDQAGIVIPLGGDGLRLRTRSRIGRSLHTDLLASG